MKFFEVLGKIDRRIIYLVLAIVVIVPLITTVKLPSVRGLPRTRQLFEAVESLKGTGKALMISVDFDPQSSPELYPMLEAIIRHAFARDIPVIGLAIWQTGTGLGEEALRTIAKEYNKKYGKDYVYLGWKWPPSAVMLSMGNFISQAFPLDYYGTPVDSLPLIQKIKNYKQIGLIISLSAGSPGYATWITYAHTKFGVPVGAGVTAVSAADAYPFLPTKQLVGLLVGMKAAAEYENMVEQHKYGYITPGVFKRATQSMPAVSGALLVMMIFVIFANISYFATRRKK